METKHAVIVHHADHECSTEGNYADRAEAILAAETIASTLDYRESVTVCGYTIRGKVNRKTGE